MSTTRKEQIKHGKAVTMSTLRGVRGPVTEVCLVEQMLARGLDRMLADEVFGWLLDGGVISETTIDGRPSGFGILRAYVLA